MTPQPPWGKPDSPAPASPGGGASGVSGHVRHWRASTPGETRRAIVSVFWGRDSAEQRHMVQEWHRKAVQRANDEAWGVLADHILGGGRFPPRRPTLPPIVLKPGEVEVLRCAADGLTIPETAVELGLSLDGVKHRRERIFKKLDVHTMPHAVAEWIRQG